MVKEIIFDFFGTLVNYDPTLTGRDYGHCEKLLEKNGFVLKPNQFIIAFSSAFERLEESSKAHNKEFNMMDVAQLYFEVEFGVKVEHEIADELIFLFMEAWGEGISYHNGIKQFVEKLSKDFRLSLICNTHYPPIIHDHLNRMDIHSLFSEIVTSAEHGYRKPDIRIFRDTVNKLSASPEGVLFVGDSFEADYLGAKNAGLKAVLIDSSVKPGSIEGDRISSIFDLDKYLLGCA